MQINPFLAWARKWKEAVKILPKKDSCKLIVLQPFDMYHNTKSLVKKTKQFWLKADMNVPAEWRGC